MNPHTIHQLLSSLFLPYITNATRSHRRRLCSKPAPNYMNNALFLCLLSCSPNNHNPHNAFACFLPVYKLSSIIIPFFEIFVSFGLIQVGQTLGFTMNMATQIAEIHLAAAFTTINIILLGAFLATAWKRERECGSKRRSRNFKPMKI
ncbi:uncharacterized protein F4822DRAFT_392835 [Hypoxylon trugodes]|uniref:uncharacterized protein n=1 Tax=Hypoxylon trugodes TaxID=326681 RepID=UPI0021A17858|nr:uncharacterized protein F4822DRAFT_392835 [Hypoxylon trugodes]KAI1393009.1 hypothetical protein F4822DRAFT_392835 [Hypoxylon trugodes]